MNTYRISLAAALAAMGLSAPIARGQVCDLNFNVSAGFWDNPASWLQGRVPNNTDIACIPAGKTALIRSNAVAKAIVVMSDGTNGPGKLEVTPTKSLTISADSTIDGELNVYGDAVLNLDGNVAINGIGLAVGEFYAPDDPIIQSTAGNEYTLTIGTGVRMEGLWDIRTTLVNNGTVAATTGTIKVSGGGDGTGVWAAETATGRLLITGGEIIGTGHWKLIDNAAATIQFDTACDCLHGPVTVTQGTLIPS